MYFFLSECALDRLYVTCSHNFMFKRIGAQSVSKNRNIAAIPENPVTMRVLLMKVLPTKPSAGGKPRPTTLSVVALEDVDVPYLYREPGKESKNLVKKREGAPPIHIKAGEETHLISIFTMGPRQWTEGAFYNLVHVVYDSFQLLVTDEVRDSMQCSLCTRLQNVEVESMMQNVSFASRSFDLERDVPGEDLMQYEVTPSYRFVWVKLGVEESEMRQDQLYGGFLALPDGVEELYQYKPHSAQGEAPKPMITALTGGKGEGDSAKDAELCIHQNVENPFFVLGLTKVYETGGLDQLMMDFVRLGPQIKPHLAGDLFCTISREKTLELGPATDPMIRGTVALSTVFRPDLARIARSAGVRVSWRACVRLEKRLGAPEALVGGDPDLNACTAINLMVFSGNASYMPLAEERGWMEFYVVTNMPFDEVTTLESLRAMSEDELVNELNDTRMFRVLKGRETAIFAVPTSACPAKVYELVSTRGAAVAKASLFDDVTKRARLE